MNNTDENTMAVCRASTRSLLWAEYGKAIEKTMHMSLIELELSQLKLQLAGWRDGWTFEGGMGK